MSAELRPWTTPGFLPDPALSFPQVFANRAAQNPQQPALYQVAFQGREPQAMALSFLKLSQRTQKAAQCLASRGVRAGDRVILSLADAGVFSPFLLGAQCLGAIPVPLPSVAELPQQAYGARIRSVVGDAQPRAIVLDDAGALDAIDAGLRDTFAVIDAAELDQADADAPANFSWSRQPEEIAFLQYTSGSTGQPKGVVVLHANLVANLRAMIEGLHIGPADRLFSWLPLFHDMGLVAGLLMGMYAGIPAYVTPPKNFVARPDSWLRAISRFQITFSPGPNFAFSVLARRVPDAALQGLNLSSWRLACDGAEPIDAATAREFVRRLAPFGLREKTFRAVYGLAECTLAATVPEFEAATRFDCVDRHQLAESGVAAPVPAGHPDAVELVGVGRAVPGHTVRIFEPGTDFELPERRLGEIGLSGPSVTPCYFHELIAGAAPRKLLRTGDLGYLADGELYVVDRLKDILIVGGRKYAPSDLEQVVAATPGVRRSAVAAFTSRRDEGTDALVLALAPDPRTGVEAHALLRDVRSVVYRCFGLTPADIVLVRPGDLPKTSSGKLQRAACRSLYESGQWMSLRVS